MDALPLANSKKISFRQNSKLTRVKTRLECFKNQHWHHELSMCSINLEEHDIIGHLFQLAHSHVVKSTSSGETSKFYKIRNLRKHVCCQQAALQIPIKMSSSAPPQKGQM